MMTVIKIEGIWINLANYFVTSFEFIIVNFQGMLLYFHTQFFFLTRSIKNRNVSYALGSQYSIVSKYNYIGLRISWSTG